MFEKIVVPLDGSDTAEAVLPYVENVGVNFGSRIELISASDPGHSDTRHLYYSYLEHVASHVEQALTAGKVPFQGKVSTKLLAGRPADEILKYADEIEADLIALTNRGSSEREEWTLGSVAFKILRAMDRPVLLVRAPTAGKKRQESMSFRRILVPLDGSKTAECSIPYAESLAKTVNGEIVLLQAVERVRMVGGFDNIAPAARPPAEESLQRAAASYLENVRSRLKEGLKTTTEVVWGAPAEQIIDYAEANNIDLICISTHGETGISRWAFGSNTEKVIHSGNTPLLVVKPG